MVGILKHRRQVAKADAATKQAFYVVFATFVVGAILPQFRPRHVTLATAQPSRPAPGSSTVEPADEAAARNVTGLELPVAAPPANGNADGAGLGRDTKHRKHRRLRRPPLDSANIRTQAQYVHGFERAGYVPLTQSPPETASPTPIADLSADQLRARAAALDGQLEKQREATSQLLDYCDSFQFVLDARERQLGGQRRALSRLHNSGDAELAAAERRADEAEVAATFLQQQVDDLSGKLADSEAAATARVADLANELKQARELKAASERLAHEVTDAGDATMSEHQVGALPRARVVELRQKSIKYSNIIFTGII